MELNKKTMQRIMLLITFAVLLAGSRSRTGGRGIQGGRGVPAVINSNSIQ